MPAAAPGIIYDDKGSTAVILAANGPASVVI
jgi:hypothetical protein